MKRLNILQETSDFPNKVNRKFYINNLLFEVSFKKQSPFDNTIWANYVKKGLKVTQVILICDANEDVFRFLAVKVEDQLHWYDKKKPFVLRNRIKEYSIAHHDNF